MGNKHTKTTDLTILQLMEILSENSDDSQLGEEFWTENGDAAQELGKRLAITPAQAVLLSVCLLKGPRNVDFDDIARHLDISNIRALSFCLNLAEASPTFAAGINERGMRITVHRGNQIGGCIT